jgi:DHA2 family multidrug resistance protein
VIPEHVPRNSALRGGGRVVGPKGLITIVSMLGAFIAVVDSSIVNVALPSIRASIGATLHETSWIATAYMISNVVIIPMTGFFQRRIGFRLYFVGSMALFMVASILCALSWDLTSIVTFRMLQGLGGGALIPTASSLLLDRYPEKDRNMATALFGMGAMAGPMLGPSLGGWLTDHFSWHMIFLINVPIGIAEIGLAWIAIREDRSGIVVEPVDWAGIGLLAAWLATLQYILEEGNGAGWLSSPRILWTAVASAVFFLFFIERELSTPHPVVNLRFFAGRQYALSTAINMGLGLALFGGLYLFSLYCGVVLNYTALQSGTVIFYAAILQMATMPIVGKIASVVDRRLLLALGLGLMVSSLYQYTAFSGGEGFWNMQFPQLLRASGMGFVFISVGTLALDGIAAKDVGDATGLFSLTRELGGSFGVAALATVITRQSIVHGSLLGETLSSVSAATGQRLAAIQAYLTHHMADPARAAGAAHTFLAGDLARRALVLAFNDAFALTTLSAGLLVVMIPFLRRAAVAEAGGH